MSLTSPRDPLLAIARLCTSALMALFACVAAAVLFAAVAVLVVPTVLRGYVDKGMLQVQMHDAAPELSAAMLTPGFLVMVALMLLIVVAMLVAAVQFLRLLRRIIDSVGAGDPFAPVNATRLAQMGWLLVAVELGSLPLHALAEWIGDRVKQGDLSVDMDVSIGNLFVALVLFILARVFREGARMRADLEGTV